jgi:hypothetical protein
MRIDLSFSWASGYNENRARRMPDDVFGGAAKQHVLETRSSVRGSHN